MQTPDPQPPPALAGEPVDSDVDLRVGRRAARSRRGDITVLAVISLGGAAGAAVRYLLGLAVPQQAGGFPATTFAINVVGSALIGILMVLVTDVWTQRPLIRPFLGTGFLGGFTTFSTFAVEIENLVTTGHPVPALVYLAATPVSAVLAVWATASATRRLITWRTR
jgi:CrcB protein